MFALDDPVTLTFDPKNIADVGLAMDYPCARFEIYMCRRFDFRAQTNKQTNKHTHKQRRKPFSRGD